MRNYDYPSEICLYCGYTDYGFAPINTGPWNLCEGRWCEEAYIKWQEDNSDDDRTFEELF